MTRDEAIKIFSAVDLDDTAWGLLHNGAWIDMFAALGMLKLDEPLSLEKKIDMALAPRGQFYLRDTENIVRALDAMGLTIVEKTTVTRR